MVAPSAGGVVLVPFPFSDLSQAKLRPAVVLAGTNQELMVAQVAALCLEMREQIIEAVVTVLRGGGVR